MQGFGGGSPPLPHTLLIRSRCVIFVPVLARISPVMPHPLPLRNRRYVWPMRQSHSICDCIGQNGLISGGANDLDGAQRNSTGPHHIDLSWCILGVPHGPLLQCDLPEIRSQNSTASVRSNMNSIFNRPTTKGVRSLRGSMSLLVMATALAAAPLAQLCLAQAESTAVRANPTQLLQNLGIQDAYASNFPGGDCGAKINAAGAALGLASGVIRVTQKCGAVWTTPVTVRSGHELEFVQGGTYTIGATITMLEKSSIRGMPSATNFAQVILQEAAGANLAEVVHMTGGYDVLEDIFIDVNKSSNPKGLHGVLVDNANRVVFKGVTMRNATVDNIHVIGPHSCCGRIIDGSLLIAAGNDDLYIEDNADWIISTTEFESAGAWGIEGLNAPTERINNSDFGGNGIRSGGGIKIWVSPGPKHHAGGWIVSGCQFGNNLGTDILSDGSAIPWSNGWHVITGNSFIGLGPGVQDNTFDAIHLQDSGNSAITGNFFGGGGSQRFRYRYFASSTNGVAAPSAVTGNVMDNGGAGTGDFYALPHDAIGLNAGAGAVTTGSSGKSQR
jgi:hypothetical protein